MDAAVLSAQRCRAYPPDGDRSQGSGVLGAHLLTPETESTTLYHFSASRHGKVLDAHEDQAAFKQWLADARKHAFQNQDEPMIEAQFRMLKSFPAATATPVLLEIDAGPMRCNRILDDLIRREQADALPPDGATSGTRRVTPIMS